MENTVRGVYVLIIHIENYYYDFRSMKAVGNGKLSISWPPVIITAFLC